MYWVSRDVTGFVGLCGWVGEWVRIQFAKRKWGMVKIRIMYDQYESEFLWWVLEFLSGVWKRQKHTGSDVHYQNWWQEFPFYILLNSTNQSFFESFFNFFVLAFEFWINVLGEWVMWVCVGQNPICKEKMRNGENSNQIRIWFSKFNWILTLGDNSVHLFIHITVSMVNGPDD